MATDQNAPQEAQQQPASTATPAKLEQLKVSAMKEYALKNYAAAAELYSEAAEMQDEINGEMVPENADVLYQYGRSLYHVGVSKSDVLGGKVAQQDEPKRKKRKIKADSDGAVTGDLSEAANSALQSTSNDRAPAATPASKPFFQITGDENWTDSEDEGEDAEGEGDGEGDEEEDDLAIAYEILDTARVLFKRKINTFSDMPDPQRHAELRALKERLADTHDLQAEIKLENEQFSDAVNDAKEALSIKLELYPQESGMIAEAHYKLSIALDFASLPAQPAEDADQPQAKVEEGQVDEALRQEAAEQMEKAILSCQAKIGKEEAQLAQLDAKKLESAKRGIADTQDMIKDMKVRLADLRSAPITVAASLNEADTEGKNQLKGIMGELLGSSKAEHTRRIQEVTQQANDLTGLIKQKKKPKQEPGGNADSSLADKGKRKADDDEPDSRNSGKKVKFEVEL